MTEGVTKNLERPHSLKGKLVIKKNQFGQIQLESAVEKINDTQQQLTSVSQAPLSNSPNQKSQEEVKESSFKEMNFLLEGMQLEDASEAGQSKANYQYLHQLLPEPELNKLKMQMEMASETDLCENNPTLYTSAPFNSIPLVTSSFTPHFYPQLTLAAKSLRIQANIWSNLEYPGGCKSPDGNWIAPTIPQLPIPPSNRRVPASIVLPTPTFPCQFPQPLPASPSFSNVQNVRGIDCKLIFEASNHLRQAIGRIVIIPLSSSPYMPFIRRLTSHAKSSFKPNSICIAKVIYLLNIPFSNLNDTQNL